MYSNHRLQVAFSATDKCPSESKDPYGHRLSILDVRLPLFTFSFGKQS